MGAPLTLRQRLADALRQNPPMTARDVAVEVGASFEATSARLSEMRRNEDPLSRTRIAGYVREEVGGHLYPRALWTLGHKPDAAKPPRLSGTETNRRHRTRKAQCVTSVFDLGRPANTRKVPADWRYAKATKA